ncbi:MAG: PHP domain-containing protein [Clostridiales bacterium]|nr:PHP domain-containing protein [Clostridiales bacterium]
MCKTIDLHTHSYCSDGTFSPEGLVILAKKQGLSAIALTDHDTIDGLELFLEAGEKHGMETICGIEFAALYEGFHRPEIHIVGLGFDRHDPMLLEKLEKIGRSCPKRWRRNHHPCPLCQCAVGKETHQRPKRSLFQISLSRLPRLCGAAVPHTKRLHRSHQKRRRCCCFGASYPIRLGHDSSGNSLQRIDSLWSGRHRMPLLHLYASPDKSRGKNRPHFGSASLRRQ